MRLIGPNTAGDCVENEHPSATNHDTLEQGTTKGLLVWSNSKRLAMFTDGATSWYGCGNTAGSAPSDQPFDCSKVPAEGSTLEAGGMCREFVKNRLRAPATAKFAGLSDTTSVKLDDGSFLVRSYVDAQNGFGALIRTYYRCQVRPIDRDNWGLIALDM